MILQKKGKKKLLAFLSFATALVRTASDSPLEIELVDVQAKRMVRLFSATAGTAAALAKEISELIDTTLSQGYNDYLDELEEAQEEDARLTAEHSARVAAEKREIEESKRWLQQHKEKQDAERLAAARQKPATIKRPGMPAKSPSGSASMSFEEWKRQRAKPLPKAPSPAVNPPAHSSHSGSGSRFGAVLRPVSFSSKASSSASGPVSPRPVHSSGAVRGFNKSSGAPKCSKCNALIQVGSRFCSGCGELVSTQNAAPSSMTSSGTADASWIGAGRRSLHSGSATDEQSVEKQKSSATSSNSKRFSGTFSRNKSSPSPADAEAKQREKDAKEREKKAKELEKEKEKEAKKKEKEKEKKLKEQAKEKEKREKEEKKKAKEAEDKRKKEEAKRVREEEQRKRKELKERAKPPPAQHGSAGSSSPISSKFKGAISAAKQTASNVASTVSSAASSSSSSSGNCSQCHSKFINDKQRFCSKCGAKRAGSSSSASSVKSSKPKCGKCGTLCPVNASFCNRCGGRVSKSTAPAATGKDFTKSSPSKPASSSASSSPKPAAKKWGFGSSSSSSSSSSSAPSTAKPAPVKKKWGSNASTPTSSARTSATSSFVKNAPPATSGTGKCSNCGKWKVAGVCRNCS